MRVFFARVVIRWRLGRSRARSHVHVHHPLDVRARAQRVARDVRQTPVQVARRATQAIVLGLHGAGVDRRVSVVVARLARRLHLHAPARARGAARVARADASRREPDARRAGRQRVQRGAGEQTRAGRDAVRRNRAPLALIRVRFAFVRMFSPVLGEEPRAQHGLLPGERAGDLDGHRVPVWVRREQLQRENAVEVGVDENFPRRRRDDRLRVYAHRRDGGRRSPIRVRGVIRPPRVVRVVHDDERYGGVRRTGRAARIATAGLGREPDAFFSVAHGARRVGAGARRSARRERNLLALLPVRGHLEQRAARHDRVRGSRRFAAE